MSFTVSQIRTGLNISVTIAFFGTLLGSLLMIAEALRNSEHFEHLYSILLLINAGALFGLLTLVSLNVHALLRQVYKGRAGARLTMRLVSLMVILSTVPVLIVYYFSLEFVNQRLDNWFNVNIEIALELSRAALNDRLSEAFKQANAIANEITLLEDNVLAIQLNELRNQSGALELTLLATNGQIIASSSADTSQLLPHRLDENLLLQFKRRSDYISSEPLLEQGLIRVILKLGQDHQDRILYALFFMTDRVRELARNVEAYKERAYLHQPFKLSLNLVLSLVLLLSLFGAVWMALFAARRFVEPLSHLAEGTQAVAEGNYEKQLPVSQLDELGFLVQSFNEMTKKIAQARNEVESSQQLAESQRIYLETVLEHLSSGVIAFDHQHCLRTANAAADQILGLPLTQLLSNTLIQLQNDYPMLCSLCTAIQPYLKNHAQNWREEMTFFGNTGRKILICRGTRLQLSSTAGYQEGYVVVFDDVTALVTAQRAAAWSEVARRLAHEIKNPLTPIQLSAERLRHKYLPRLSASEADILDRMTHTIIQQVEAMKEMVNAFADYAKTPVMQRRTFDLNELIREVLDLYHHIPIPMTTQLAEIPLIWADRGHLRQVLHNLLKNALEVPANDNAITITTRYLTESSFECIELRIQDQGPGIPAELQEQVFEPYFTTKSKGTGLGLAIVKKIIEEQGGIVWIENHPGACIIIRLPLGTEVLPVN
ncbi:signal transduction histidine kinase involved in nitrogen fixation and metabolism regulation [Thioploca ingrica]|uniref:histidine kinase n=1 Tax=Thioploca ingrica TaxID=40754 RepID=A0A090ALZ8_9GAMM|nr:signal transduction histidine kinase involved in nitrogen fixation and metabolism regulation [Thioploca ingrica]